MSRETTEIIILAINAVGAGILIFVARVIQPMMSALSALEFKTFLSKLELHAMRDPVSVTIATLPVIGAAIYLPLFGLDHWWFTSGLLVWLIGSSITKIVNLPIYRWARKAAPDASFENSGQRRLKLGNSLRAWLTMASVLLMACQFGWKEVALAGVASLVLAVPLMLLARRERAA